MVNGHFNGENVRISVCADLAIALHVARTSRTKLSSQRPWNNTVTLRANNGASGVSVTLSSKLTVRWTGLVLCKTVRQLGEMGEHYAACVRRLPRSELLPIPARVVGSRDSGVLPDHAGVSLRDSWISFWDSALSTVSQSNSAGNSPNKVPRPRSSRLQSISRFCTWPDWDPLCIIHP